MEEVKKDKKKEGITEVETENKDPVNSLENELSDIVDSEKPNDNVESEIPAEDENSEDSKEVTRDPNNKPKEGETDENKEDEKPPEDKTSEKAPEKSLEDREKELAKREEDLARREIEAEAKNILRTKGLSEELMPLVLRGNLEDTEAAVKLFEKALGDQVEKKLGEVAKGKSPEGSKGNIDKDTGSITDIVRAGLRGLRG